MDINQKEFIIKVKFGLNQLVSQEPEMFVPTTIIGQVAKHCNHEVESLDENNNIKKVYNYCQETKFVVPIICVHLTVQ